MHTGAGVEVSGTHNIAFQCKVRAALRSIACPKGAACASAISYTHGWNAETRPQPVHAAIHHLFCVDGGMSDGLWPNWTCNPWIFTVFVCSSLAWPSGEWLSSRLSTHLWPSRWMTMRLMMTNKVAVRRRLPHISITAHYEFGTFVHHVVCLHQAL